MNGENVLMKLNDQKCWKETRGKGKGCHSCWKMGRWMIICQPEIGEREREREREVKRERKRARMMIPTPRRFFFLYFFLSYSWLLCECAYMGEERERERMNWPRDWLVDGGEDDRNDRVKKQSTRYRKWTPYREKRNKKAKTKATLTRRNNPEASSDMDVF